MKKLSIYRNDIHVRLEKLLLMVDVLRFEVLKQWLSHKIWEKFNLAWTIQLLCDLDYRRWLWNEIFLHASKEAMTLVKALRPTGSAITTLTYFRGFASQAPVPRFILSSLKEIREFEDFQRLSRRPIFNVRLHGVPGFFKIPEIGISTTKPSAYEDYEYLYEEDEPRNELDRLLIAC